MKNLPSTHRRNPAARSNRLRSAMNSFLAYGSLMHPRELDQHVAADLPRSPVLVRGFRRSFSQEPSWRTASGEERGVLTVRPSQHDWFNAILVRGCAAPVMDMIDHRERGYVRHPVRAMEIDPYGEFINFADDFECIVYVGREDRRTDGLLPNADYLQLCIEAAEQWGPRFLQDFLKTTFIGRAPLLETSRGRQM